MSLIPSWYFDSMQHDGDFHTNRALEKKVDEKGCLKSFIGETAVFLLPDDLKDALEKVQKELYTAVGVMLSREVLSRESLHMTLHDLWNEADNEKHPPYTHEDICRVIEGIRKDYPRKIMMRTVTTMNMVNSSVVVGLVPDSEEDFAALIDMHSRLDAIYPLSYGLTPHITLGYYKPGVYPEEIWKGLRGVFKVMEQHFYLDTASLVFQRFSDMEHYETIY